LFEADVKSGFYNVSTGVGKSIFELYKVVAQYLGSDNFDVPIVPVGEDDVPAVVLDPSLTESTFNWKAKIDFETTIINQLKWYDKYGVNDIYSHLAEPKSE
jgi:UDP-glucose 4-epimerase